MKRIVFAYQKLILPNCNLELYIRDSKVELFADLKTQTRKVRGKDQGEA